MERGNTHGRVIRIRWFIRTVVTCAALAWAAGRADAQGWAERGYLSASFGAQPQSRTFNEVSRPIVYGESAQITVPHEIGTGGVFDVSAGLHIWEAFGLGVGYSRFNSSESPAIDARVPNPLEFNRLRAASGQVGDVAHSESAIHALILWRGPTSSRMAFTAMLGPSFLNVRQDLVQTFTTVEGANPSVAPTISGVTVESQSKQTVALTLGADFTYFVTDTIGIGGLVRFERVSGANVDMTTSSGTEVSVPAGGMQIGAGLRFRFR